MPRRSEDIEIEQAELTDPTSPRYGSNYVFAVFWALLFLGNIFVAAPWAPFHGVLFSCIGLLVLLRPPIVSVPRSWWILAGLFLLFASSAFFPASWFGIPAWREGLEKVGIETGGQVAIQVRHAAETLGVFAIMLVTGLWLAGHRASPQQLRLWALLFTFGVAFYAIAARLLQDSLQTGVGLSSGHFGFFPNRNHTATYLAMGSITGLGCSLQAFRDKRFPVMTAALLASAVCLWAATAWSISRAGVVLLAIGCILWLPMLGRRYLGRHGLWAVGLTALTVIGLFFIVDSRVKQRISETLEKSSALIASEKATGFDEPQLTPGSGIELDFRVPTAIDTFGLIKEFPWTGVGAGQFRYVFPQYRNLTSVADHADTVHPESDWLWMASETGIPATLTLLLLVVSVFIYALFPMLRGKDRALRSACFVAAALVAIHGLFDVPGHRVTLAWGAVFLLVLSLHPRRSEISRGLPSVWPSRLFAVGILCLAVFLIRSHWFAGPQPAIAHAAVALQQAKHLHREDLVLQKAAAEQGILYDPEPADDPLEQALTVVREAQAVIPLDRNLLRYEAFLASFYDDKYEVIDRAFAAERTLDPTWVAGVFNQASAWSSIDPERTRVLWEETLARARRLERIHPENPWSADKVLQRMETLAKRKPELQSRLPSEIRPTDEE